jgi:predicted alpha/beta superfamily hydrolase
MKSFYCSLIFLLFSFYVHAQENNRFTTGSSETISSKILGENREILIHIPNSNGGSKIKDRGHYPVIYLLDGAENFNSVVSITEHMEETSLCPPMIVVGIVHSNRLGELTTGSDKDFKGFVGNGEQFMSFVEKELIPYIDLTYPTTTYKTFIGHSVGGLTVMNTLLHKPDLFNSYVSLDGALWWNKVKVVQEAKTLLSTQNYKGKTLYIAMANRLERGVDTLSVQKDTSENTDLIRANLRFIKELQKANRNQLRYKFKFYEDDNHPSVRFIGEYDALRYIFDFYRLRIYDSEMADPDFNLDSLLVAHYNNVSKQMGYRIKPGERQVNSLGYQMIATKQFKKAESLFKLNIANYPSNGDWYDSLGDLYVAVGNKAKAVDAFKNALKLKNIPESKAKLEKLLSEKK